MCAHLFNAWSIVWFTRGQKKKKNVTQYISILRSVNLLKTVTDTKHWPMLCYRLVCLLGVMAR
jgi:hypothetical protein